MKRLGLLTVLFVSLNAFSQGKDTLLQGKWELFQIIDNMTGEAISPEHKSKEEHQYYIEFNGNLVKYNLEINKCTNEIIVGRDNSIEFKYFSECTEICCDEDFSALLTYDECTKYYIKSNGNMLMVSEDRIFYFKKVKA